MNTKIRSFSIKAMTALALLQANPLEASNLETVSDELSLPANNLDTMPNQVLGRISVYLPLSDLQSFEQVCTKTAKGLRDASLYNALTLDHSLKDSTGSELPSKDKFLNLLNTGNGDFILTLAKFMLDQNIFDGEQYQAFDFPFKSEEYRPKIKPFRKLRVSLNDLINGFRTLSPEKKIRARYYLAAMNYLGQGGPQDFVNARTGFRAVVTDPSAPADVKAIAQLHFAEMDLFGQGGPQDFVNARTGFDAVITDPSASADVKAKAQYYLAAMNYLGQGGPQDFVNARAGFRAVITNPSTPADVKAKAHYFLAQMHLRGQGGAQDFVAARAGFMAVLNDPATPAHFRALAQYRLAAMNSLGLGDLQNPSAVQGPTGSEPKGDENKRIHDDSEDENSDTPSRKKARRGRKG